MADFIQYSLKQLNSDLSKLPPSDLASLARLSAANISNLKSGHIENIMSALIRTRQFELSAELGRAIDGVGNLTPLSSRLFVQALIDTGRLFQAEVAIDRLLKKIPPEDSQYLELKGLSARAAKQRYMNDALTGTPQPKDLIRAIDTYLSSYEEDPSRPSWHGINAVALLARAKRDRVTHPACDRMFTMARDIFLQKCRGLEAESLTFFDLATASEAALALGDRDSAELWLHRYIGHSDVPSFAISSTLRQYAEVWQLDLHSLPGSRLLPLLERHLLSFGQAQFSFQDMSGALSQGSFEKVFGKSSFLSYGKYVAGVERAKAVARVEDRDGDPYGTGFVVRGADLSARWKDYPQLLVTNAHVISSKDPKAALRPEQARFSFYGQTQTSPPTRTVSKELWTSSSKDYDTTIILMDKDVPGVLPYQQASSPPKPGSGSKVFIIGYPGGGGLSFSLFDSHCLDYEGSSGTQSLGRKIHYRTPTEPGSSGSPVFNQNWELLAIHHAGDEAMPKLNGQTGTYQANEGLLIEAIRTALMT